jgi:hypothetical protein
MLLVILLLVGTLITIELLGRFVLWWRVMEYWWRNTQSLIFTIDFGVFLVICALFALWLTHPHSLDWVNDILGLTIL